MTLYDIVTWLLFGLIVGTVANVVDPYPQRMGIVNSILIGIVGAVLGGMIANLLGFTGVTGFNVSSFIVALIGSLIALAIGRMAAAPRYGHEYYDDYPPELEDEDSVAARPDTK